MLFDLFFTMATAKQRRAASIVAENGGIVSKAMLEAGYSPMTAQDPSKLTRSKGYKEIMDQYGLTESLIVKSLADDIRKKPKDRIPELTLGAKMRGMLVDRTELTGKDGGAIALENVSLLKLAHSMTPAQKMEELKKLLES